MMANWSTEESEGRLRLLCTLISLCKPEHSMAPVIKAHLGNPPRQELQKSLGDSAYMLNTGLHTKMLYSVLTVQHNNVKYTAERHTFDKDQIKAKLLLNEESSVTSDALYMSYSIRIEKTGRRTERKSTE